MTTYRLPEVLGNAEVREAVDQTGGNTWPNHLVVEAYDSAERVTWYVLVPKAALTEVKPPLPEEPTEQGWYLATTQVDGFTEPLERRNDGWYVWRTGQLHGSWSSVWGEDSWIESVTITRLLPAPEPVTLPWSMRTLGGTDVEVTPDEDNDVGIVNPGDGDIWMKPPAAREMARALNTAADKAEAEATS